MDSQYTFNGLISSQPFPNGNMPGITAYAAMRGLISERAATEAIMPCFKEGLLSRYPDKVQDASIDDYLNVSCLPECAALIADSGKKYGWIFDLEKQGIKYFLRRCFFRFPALIAQTRITQGVRPNPCLRLAWALSILITAQDKNRTNKDAWMQTYCMVSAFENRPTSWSPLMLYAVKKWHKAAPPQSLLFWEYSQDKYHPLSSPIDRGRSA